MTWLGTDLNLLETDTEQLRRHLGWLLEDLRTHQTSLSGRTEALNALVGEVAECLERLRRFDTLLDAVRQAVSEPAVALPQSPKGDFAAAAAAPSRESSPSASHASPAPPAHTTV